jgi:2-polyprenyl-3-methyl-5-hydroxy-6-metoxy-1,4-benzoquinol methylase
MGVGPDRVSQLRQQVERRLQDAQTRAKRTDRLVQWQRELIRELTEQGRYDVNLAREVLVSLIESQRWHEAQASQISKELDFLVRHST